MVTKLAILKVSSEPWMIVRQRGTATGLSLASGRTAVPVQLASCCLPSSRPVHHALHGQVRRPNFDEALHRVTWATHDHLELVG